MRFRRSPSVPWRTVGTEVLLASPGREDFDGLSGTSATVWHLLEAPRSLQELVELLADIYATSPEAIAGEVEQLVDELLRRGSIQQEDEVDG
jgi:coenzyme PQQ synthesis protein D (PqqD)